MAVPPPSDAGRTGISALLSVSPSRIERSAPVVYLMSFLLYKIHDFVDKGVEYFIFTMDYEGEEEALKLFVEDIMPVF